MWAEDRRAIYCSAKARRRFMRTPVFTAGTDASVGLPRYTHTPRSFFRRVAGRVDFGRVTRLSLLEIELIVIIQNQEWKAALSPVSQNSSGRGLC